MPVVDASVALKWFVDEPLRSAARAGGAHPLELTHAVIRLASHYRLTSYDALDVGLAQELGTELITADRRLHHRVSHLPFVRLLH